MHETSLLVEHVGGIIALLLVAAAVMAVSKKLKVPFTVLLVVVGASISFISETFADENIAVLKMLEGLSLSPDLILYVFLPTLIFESAFNLNARQLWQNIVPILTLAVPGLLLSTGVIAGVLLLATSIPLLPALLLGAILSATDPVAVIALFKQLGAPKRLAILVEGESLLNDATAIVLASILIAAISLDAGAHKTSSISAVVEFLAVFLGGLIVGWVLGIVTAILLGMVRADVYIETTLTTILAYTSFLIAEQVFHVSGVVAVVAAGLTLGSWGRIKISPSVRQYIDHFWEYMSFVATALIFLMVGMRVNLEELLASSNVLPWVVFGMLLSRAIVVYGMIPLSNKLPGRESTNRAYQTVMYWGGLRGAIALALVLSIPAFEYSELFIALVMGAVLFTLIVQGLSIEWLVARLGLSKPPLSDRIAESEGNISATEEATFRLNELQSGGFFSAAIADRLQQQCAESLSDERTVLNQLRRAELNEGQEIVLLYLRCYGTEEAQYNDLYAKGHLSETTVRNLMTTLTAQTEAVKFLDEAQLASSNKLPEPNLAKYQLSRGLLRLIEKVPGLSTFTERLRLEQIAVDYEESWARYHACTTVLADMEKLKAQTELDPVIFEGVNSQYRNWLGQAEQSIDGMAEQYPEFVSSMQERLGKRLILLSESEAIQLEDRQGNIPRSLAQKMTELRAKRLWDLRGHEIARLRVAPEELLRKVPFFAEIPAEEFEALTRKMKRHSVATNEKVIQQGNSGKRLYMIARGVVRISQGIDGEEVNLATLIAGDFFGEMALLHDGDRTATVTSISPCTFYILERDDLQHAMLDNPSIRKALEVADKQRHKHQDTLP
ncbi:MAG: CPA1 family monovalent cation:H+ antiporter [Candidatus Azotimanducaceae bacterium]